MARRDKRRNAKFEQEREDKAQPIVAKTNGQRVYLKALQQKILIVPTGSAGTGKTFIAAAHAANRLVRGEVESVVLSRPYVPMGRSSGFFPGPQPLTAGILTPSGWTTMGEIQEGDFVIGVDGNPTEVIGVYDFEGEDVYEVRTTTKKITHCTETHLWETKTYNENKQGKSGSVKTLREIADTLTHNNGKLNHYLPRLAPVSFQSSSKVIHPYVLGCLLGDGCLPYNGSIILTSIDPEIPSKVSSLLTPINCSVKEPSGLHYTMGAFNGRANKPTGKNSDKSFTNPIKIELEKLGLLGKKFHNKFIPSEYIYNASVEDRMELLRGLLDTDGGVHRGCAEFHTSGKPLLEGLLELVRSLGGSCAVATRMRKYNKDNRINSTCECHTVSIKLPKEVGNPFYLKRKADQFKTSSTDGRLMSVSVDRVEAITYSSTEDVRCIRVEDPRALYVTDNFIVTHNTVYEKLEPYLKPMLNVLKQRLGDNDYDSRVRSGRIAIQAMEAIRGMSFENCILIIDEAQNTTPEEMESVVTRIGENCQIILCGDPAQSDIRGKNGLDYIAQIIEDYDVEDAKVINFYPEDNVRSGITKRFVQIFDRIRGDKK